MYQILNKHDISFLQYINLQCNSFLEDELNLIININNIKVDALKFKIFLLNCA